jgi:hypothetical protein
VCLDYYESSPPCSKAKMRLKENKIKYDLYLSRCWQPSHLRTSFVYYTKARNSRISQLTKQLLRHHTGPIIIKMHTNVNSPVIHNLKKQKLSNISKGRHIIQKLQINSSGKYISVYKLRTSIKRCHSSRPIGCCCQTPHSTILRSAHTVNLCVLCGSQNKQRLFPYTTLTDWFL